MKGRVPYELREHVREARIVQQLEECKMVEPFSGCWLWTGEIGNTGYGRIKAGKFRASVHRLSYERAKGKIPDEMCIDHLCKTPICFNPDHLEVVTYSENTLRGDLPRLTREKILARTICKNGHPRTQENTYQAKGQRVCRVCQRMWNAAYRIRRRL